MIISSMLGMMFLVLVPIEIHFYCPVGTDGHVYVDKSGIHFTRYVTMLKYLLIFPLHKEVVDGTDFVFVRVYTICGHQVSNEHKLRHLKLAP